MADLDKIYEKIGKEKFEPREEVVVTTEERINDLEIAICELLEAISE